MRVLLTGASGFIGRHVAAALTASGHEVTAAVRRPDPFGELAQVAGDFRVDIEPAAWLPRLRDIDAVVNAVGILRESGTQTFAALHADAPKALFSACASAGVRKVIQISALGAEPGAFSRYHRSKAEADRHLATLPLDWIVLQPSLVFGTGGASACLFATLAAMPLIPLPGEGGQRIQPVHVTDLAALCVRLLERSSHDRRVLPVVGPTPYSVRGLLAELRLGMGLTAPRFVRVPMRLVRAAAQMAARLPRIPLDPETLDMLQRGNTAPADAMVDALGRKPRPVVPLAIEASAGRPGAVADWARLNAMLPLLRWSIGLMWILTGVVSLGLYPVERSYALLASVGIGAAMAPLFLYGAALLDLALGIAVFVLRAAATQASPP